MGQVSGPSLNVRFMAIIGRVYGSCLLVKFRFNFSSLVYGLGL